MNMAGTKDIKDFTKYPSLSDDDIILGSKTSLNGSDAGITVKDFRKQVAQDIKPEIKSGYWWVLGINTGVLAEGRTPVFRKTSAGLEMKHEGEDDTAYILLIPMADLSFSFDDLSPEQVEDLKLKFSDLTDADKEALRGAAFTYDMFTAEQLSDLRLTWGKLTPDQKNELKGERGYSAFEVWTQQEGNAGKTVDDYLAWLRQPATEATAEVRQQMVHISQEVSQALTASGNATKAANDAAKLAGDSTIKANNAAGLANTAAGNADRATGSAETAAGKANASAEAADEKANLASTAAGNADKATGKANAAADRSNALSDHRDEIRDGYWWRWNEETGEWYNTGEIAKGNVMYAVFDVDPATGELSMFTDDEYTGASFELNNEGILSVII